VLEKEDGQEQGRRERRTVGKQRETDGEQGRRQRDLEVVLLVPFYVVQVVVFLFCWQQGIARAGRQERREADAANDEEI
jgi:hypothetical protein